jgi:hypothetical protein
VTDALKPAATIARDAHGHVLPGSGSEFGKTSTRRLGTGSQTKMREQIDPRRQEIIAKLIETALSDGKDRVRAAEVLLARLAAPPKAQAELVHVPGLAEATTPREKADAILVAVATGQVSADAGRALLNMLDSYVRTITATDHEARLRALEGLAPRGRIIESGATASTPADDLV